MNPDIASIEFGSAAQGGKREIGDVALVTTPDDDGALEDITKAKSTIDRDIRIPWDTNRHLFTPYLALLRDAPHSAESILTEVAVVARAAMYAAYLENPGKIRIDSIDFDPVFRAVMYEPLHRILDGKQFFSADSIGAARIAGVPADNYSDGPDMNQLVKLLLQTQMFNMDGVGYDDAENSYHFTSDLARSCCFS
jgi:hypothetical protein